MLTSLQIRKRHSTQSLRIAELRHQGRQHNRLVRPKPGCGVDLSGSDPDRAQIVLGTNHKTDLLTVQGKSLSKSR
jgi:hypothetical protein